VAAAAAGETLAERLVAAAAGNVSTDPGTGGYRAGRASKLWQFESREMNGT